MQRRRKQILPTENLPEDIEYVNHGRTSSVFKAIDNKTGKKVVLKVISKEEINQEEFNNEVEILKIFEDDCDPYLLCFKRAFESTHEKKPVYVLVTEDLSDYKELYDVVSRKPYSKNKEFYQTVMSNIIKGFLVMEKKGVVHRDIKLENILVNEETGAIKFIDYGGACSIEDESCEKKRSHTLPYVPPEYFGVWTKAGLKIVKQPSKFTYRLSNGRIYPFFRLRSVNTGESLKEGRVVETLEPPYDYEPSKADIWALACTMWAIINGNLRSNLVYGEELTEQNIQYYFETYPFLPTIDEKDTEEEKKRKTRAQRLDKKAFDEVAKINIPIETEVEIEEIPVGLLVKQLRGPEIPFVKRYVIEELKPDLEAMFQVKPEKRNIEKEKE